MAIEPAFEIRLSHRCHGCNAQTNDLEGWLHPHHVWVRDAEDKRWGGHWLQTQLCPKCARWSLRRWVFAHNFRLRRLSHLFARASLSWCARCKTKWYWIESHTTRYADGQGCFPLCEPCWRDLKTPERRLPYYRGLWESWGTDHASEATWASIALAVQAGG